MDFLRQPDVLADFLAGSERLERAHALAWDLLVVDEAHNLAPLGFGERSDRSRMLADVAQHAEHRLLSLGDSAQRLHRPASPASSRCSTLCGSVRSAQLSDDERGQVELVMVRRLKSELNERAKRAGEVPPFTDRVRRKRISFNWTAEEHAARRGAPSLPPVGQRGRRRARNQGAQRRPLRLLAPHQAAPVEPVRARTNVVGPHRGLWRRGTIEEAEARTASLESQTADDLEMAQREEDVVRTGRRLASRARGETWRAARDGVSERALG